MCVYSIWYIIHTSSADIAQMTEESEKERPGVHKRCVGHNLSTTKRFQTVMVCLSYIPVFSSGVVETAVGLRIVEERVETGLKTTQSSL